MLAQLIDACERVGEFVVEGVQLGKIRPAGDDVFEIVRDDVGGGHQHRLLGLEPGFGAARTRGTGEGLVHELVGGEHRREDLERLAHWTFITHPRLNGVRYTPAGRSPATPPGLYRLFPGRSLAPCGEWPRVSGMVSGFLPGQQLSDTVFPAASVRRP